MLLSVMSVFQMYQMKVCLLCAAYILYLYQQPIPRAVSILEVGGGGGGGDLRLCFGEGEDVE